LKIFFRRFYKDIAPTALGTTGLYVNYNLLEYSALRGIVLPYFTEPTAAIQAP
jgi:hypothetical protein